jgi:hypothetical protein
VFRDFSDLLSAFNAHGVEHIVVGAHALAAHGHVRATNDLDVWVRPSAENARRAVAALTAFGAPLRDLTERDLAEPGLIFQIGVPPIRIDIMTEIAGLTFDDAWRDRVPTRFGGEATAVLSLEHLLVNKRATGRLQDQADVERIEELLRRQRDEAS